ncbi:hypothetical protein [Amycolatopsis albispora]|uniref:Uncharacterized protein n=1 Tax=Amycolatopsis albispora TaxID=1804986 RepID=A0A344KZH0_9PSEU|nr:hypothetical protein [Amycolatopsis albispora]AXB41194.1 hypothetical protein A4R43_00590 [Amycolatopsis albispora]
MTATTPDQRGATGSRTVVIAAWAAAVLVAGQFALIAVVPVAIVLIGTLASTRMRPFRWWASALAAAYALPLALWAIGPERAPSLSKDMHPALAALVVTTAVTAAIAHHLLRRRNRI